MDYRGLSSAPTRCATSEEPSNIGRAVPALGLVVFFIAFLGVGFLNVCLALVLLAIPPIITNSYVGIRGVEPETVDAARGNG
jgi:osmoprotectant transport system permease protein